MGNWGWFGMFLMLVLTVAVVALVVKLMLVPDSATSGRLAAGTGADDRSLTILRELLARGELTPDEYDRIQSTLTKSSS